MRIGKISTFCSPYGSVDGNVCNSDKTDSKLESSSHNAGFEARMSFSVSTNASLFLNESLFYGKRFLMLCTAQVSAHIGFELDGQSVSYFTSKPNNSIEKNVKRLLRLDAGVDVTRPAHPQMCEYTVFGTG